jgi:hypothetical protein
LKIDIYLLKLMTNIIVSVLENGIPELIANHLLHYQQDHVLSLIKTLSCGNLALDLSDTGTGKSFTAGAICVLLNLRPFFIGPKPGIPNLYEVCQLFGVEPLGNVNYESIKNGKYYRDESHFNMDDREECPYIMVSREPDKNPVSGEVRLTKKGTPKMRIATISWMFPPGTLVVYDEAHKGRHGKASGNETGNSKLIISTRPFLDAASRIYGLFLSATMSDKLENFDVMAYMLGLYQPYTPKVYKQFLFTLAVNKGKVFESIHDLLIPRYASRMDIKAIKKLELEIGLIDTFQKDDFKAESYEVDSATALEIEESHHKIKECLEEIRSHGLSIGWGRLIRYWQRIEILKAPIVVKEIFRWLRENRSVVVFVNFNDTKTLITKLLLESSENKMLLPDIPLAQCSPLISLDRVEFIEGGQTNEFRANVVKKWRNDDYHVLICNIRAGGIALSLHHVKVGGRPRVSLIFPTWSATELKQARGRIYRANALSDAIQRVIYVKYKKSEESTPPVLAPCKTTEPVQMGEGSGTLSIEEMLCRSVNEKLANIELFNNGNLLSLQLVADKDSAMLEKL